jgi:hypothetical protein
MTQTTKPKMSDKPVFFLRITRAGEVVNTTEVPKREQAWSTAYNWLHKAGEGMTVELVARYPDGFESVRVSLTSGIAAKV